jgi:hypothetical protein
MAGAIVTVGAAATVSAAATDTATAVADTVMERAAHTLDAEPTVEQLAVMPAAHVEQPQQPAVAIAAAALAADLLAAAMPVVAAVTVAAVVDTAKTGGLRS